MGAVVKPGVVLQDRYEVVGTLGAGGQATVFEAVDRRLGIRVAVKQSVEQRPRWREAFVRAARLLAGLRHPSLPVVSDHFVEADGQYLVLEFDGDVAIPPGFMPDVGPPDGHSPMAPES